MEDEKEETKIRMIVKDEEGNVVIDVNTTDLGDIRYSIEMGYEVIVKKPLT